MKKCIPCDGMGHQECEDGYSLIPCGWCDGSGVDEEREDKEERG